MPHFLSINKINFEKNLLSTKFFGRIVFIIYRLIVKNTFQAASVAKNLLQTGVLIMDILLCSCNQEGRPLSKNYGQILILCDFVTDDNGTVFFSKINCRLRPEAENYYF
jgi:hypothetical protein